MEGLGELHKHRKPKPGGVTLRETLEDNGWRYSDGLDGPPTNGRAISECYPYTAIVGIEELGYETERPRYKRLKPKISRQEARDLRRQEFDQLIRRMALLADADPPLRLESHPETHRLTTESTSLDEKQHKKREDLLDAAVCAWTASFWSRHGNSRCQVLGANVDKQNPLQATIIAPCRPEQRRDR